MPSRDRLQAKGVSRASLRGLLGHPGSPPLLPGFTLGPKQPFASPFWDLSFFVWKGGVWSEQRLPHGASGQLAWPCAHSAQAMVLHLQTESPGDGSGPWPWAAKSPRGQGMARPQPGVTQGRAAVVPVEEVQGSLSSCLLGQTALPGPLPAHCSPWACGQIGATDHSQARRIRPGQQLLLCFAVRAAQAWAAYESALHTHVADTLLWASVGAHVPA